MSSSSRASTKNGIWLCQNCAKLVDNDPTRFSAEILRSWKRQADEMASEEIGRQNSSSNADTAVREKELKRKLELRSVLEKALLRPVDERMRQRPHHPYSKFRATDIIIRSLTDDTYPEMDEKPGISNWFRLEAFDFYHNGLEFILGIRRAAIDSKGKWRLLDHGEVVHKDGQWNEIKVWELGRIPYRNIRACDFRGDEYYNCPHLYCVFADDGEPYEAIRYAIVGEDDEYDFPLSLDDRA